MEKPEFIREVAPHLEPNGKYIKKRKKALYRCACGNEFEAIVKNVTSGKTSSCGCLKRQKIRERCVIYEHRTEGRFSETYTSWSSMKQRATNPNRKHSHLYILRGIVIEDPRWLEFKNFFADMGERPEGKTLDRIDNNKGYSKENCHWATQKEQMRNVRCNHIIDYNGKLACIAEHAEDNELTYNLVWDRIKRNWPIEKVFTKVVKK